MLIDVHTHGAIGWKSEDVKRCLEIGGADHILLAATPLDLWDVAMNEDCDRMVREFPDRVHGLIGIHPPDVDESLRRIDRYHGKGFVGVKLMPNLGYYPDDERHRRVFEEVNARKMIVLSHCGWCARTRPKDLPQCTLFSHPYHMEPLIRIFPDTDFIFAHGGGRTMFQAAFELVNYHENAWVDTCPGQGTWVLQHAGAWLAWLNWGRVLYGTDATYGNVDSTTVAKNTTEPYVRQALKLTGFGDRTDAVMGENAARLLRKHGVKV